MSIRSTPRAFSIVGTPVPASTRSATQDFTPGGSTAVTCTWPQRSRKCAFHVWRRVALVVSAMSALRIH